MKLLLRSLLLTVALLATNTYAYNENFSVDLDSHVANMNSLVETIKNELSQSQPALNANQAKSLAAEILASASGITALSQLMTASNVLLIRQYVGSNLTAEDIESIVRANPQASLLDLIRSIELSNTRQPLFSDLLEQADDFVKLANDKSDNFKPANPTPAELKASIEALRKEMLGKTSVSDEDIKKLAGVETQLTKWQFWDRGPYVNEAMIKATTSAIDTTRDRVLQSIQTLSGRTCRWGYIAALFANGWICN